MQVIYLDLRTPVDEKQSMCDKGITDTVVFMNNNRSLCHVFFKGGEGDYLRAKLKLSLKGCSDFYIKAYCEKRFARWA